MEIHSENGKSIFQLVPCGAELANYPSLCFSAEAKTPDVSGSIGELWFELEAVERFLHGIVTLDQTRSGNVTLESISPDEFSLEVTAINKRGHIGIRFSLSGLRYEESATFSFSIAGGFQIDPTSLPSIVKALHIDILQQKSYTNSTVS